MYREQKLATTLYKTASQRQKELPLQKGGKGTLIEARSEGSMATLCDRY